MGNRRESLKCLKCAKVPKVVRFRLAFKIPGLE